MIRAIGIGLFWILATAYVVNLLEWEHAAAKLRASPSVSESVSGSVSGTLTYERNNVGNEEPYLVYKTPRGEVATFALLFTGASECDTLRGAYPCALIAGALPYYFGGNPVVARGTPVAEHLVVGRLSLALPEHP